MDKLQSTYTTFLRYMIREGMQRQNPQEYRRKDSTTGEFSKFKLSNDQIWAIARTETISTFILRQMTNWIGHCVRADDTTYIKQLTYQDFFKTDKKSLEY